VAVTALDVIIAKHIVMTKKILIRFLNLLLPMI